MPQTNNEHRSSFSWAPFTIDHLFQKHGLKRVRTVALLSLWISLVAVSMVSVFFMMSGSWVDGNLDQSAINNYFMLYPPLIIGTLLLFWLGFEWGFIPVFLATFVLHSAATCHSTGPCFLLLLLYLALEYTPSPTTVCRSINRSET